MNSRTQLSVYDTDEGLFESLSRIFRLHENDGTRWVTLQEKSGVVVTFFAADPVTDGLEPDEEFISAEEEEETVLA